MELDYQEIGRRIAKRRRELGYKQAQVEELAGIGYKYLSSIERGISIPSTEVIMRLAIALDTTSDEFLVGTARHEDAAWRDVAEALRPLTPGQLRLAPVAADHSKGLVHPAFPLAPCYGRGAVVVIARSRPVW